MVITPGCNGRPRYQPCSSGAQSLGTPPSQCSLSLLLNKVPLRMPHLQGQCWELLGGGRIDWADITALLILFAMGKMIQWELLLQGQRAKPDHSRLTIRQASLRTTTGPHTQAVHWFQPAEGGGQEGGGSVLIQPSNSCFLSYPKRVPLRSTTEEGVIHIFFTTKVNIYLG